MSKLYAVIDVETTGGKAQKHKVTEIGIVLHDETRIVDQWSTLINPEKPIPYGITELTGITNEMVAEAPKFFEVAKKIIEMTEGAVFVGHNVRFDYSFIREEFARLGYTYTRKTLCTVRLMRKNFPGLRSYSLGNLIRHYGIHVNDRHRALDDALATVNLLERCFGKAMGAEDTTIKEMINLGVRESLLPANLSVETIHGLPETPGVYYFHNSNGDVVYVGKSINIKKRVAQHFSKKTPKAEKLQRHVDSVTCTETGSELAALLLESEEIKRLMPFINRAQRRRHFPYIIHRTITDEGFICFDIAKVTARTRAKFDIVAEFPKLSSAQARMERICRDYELCPKYCGLERGSGCCFRYHIKQCRGGCAGREDYKAYNERVEQAVDLIGTIFEEDFFLIDEGRTKTEKTVFLVEEGEYKGWGYLDTQESADEMILRDAIRPYINNPETKRIIRTYMAKNGRLKKIPLSLSRPLR